MTRMNHARPELRYKDGLARLHRQFAASAKHSTAQTAQRKPVQGRNHALSEAQAQVVITMLDGMTAYCDMFSAFAGGFMKSKGQQKRANQLKKAEGVMQAGMRAYLFLCIQDSLQNGGHMSAGLVAFNRTFEKTLKDTPLIASVFTEEVANAHTNIMARLTQTPPAP